MHRLFIAILLISSMIPCTSLYGQGKLVLAGGGSEGSDWSDRAYGWGISQAENKKVGIVSFYEESQDLPQIMLSYGATEAVNIRIDTREVATADSTYDFLMQFDFLFFKGGDQSNYYRTYQGTQVTRAMIDKFSAGGVLGGTSAGLAIMTGVMYSANNGSLYPDQGLLDVGTSRIALHQDFVDVLPSYLGDTHFIERGRHFRMLAFLARWYRDTGQLINGFGVDDKTALCIDENQVGTVIGTGAVSFFIPDAFTFRNDQFDTDSLYSFQLIDSNQVDMRTGRIISTESQDVAPEATTEKGSFTLFLSGSKRLRDQQELLEAFQASEGTVNDTIVVVSGSQSSAEALNSYLDEGKVVRHLITDEEYNNSDSASLRNFIKRSDNIIFYESAEKINSFLADGPTGQLLASHIKRNDKRIALLGTDARLAGAYFCTNNDDDELDSYQNQLEFAPGLGLLQTSTFMSHTIDRSSTDYYENNTSAIQYALAKYRLKYGFYLNPGSYLLIKPEGDDLSAIQHGMYPTVILDNHSQMGGFASSRNVVAMDSLDYHVLLDEQKRNIGRVVRDDDPAYEFEEELVLSKKLDDKSIVLFPNPASEYLMVKGITEGRFQLTGLDGSILRAGSFRESIDLGNIPSGTYIITVRDGDTFLSKKLHIEK